MSYHLFLDDERIPLDVTWVNIPRNCTYAVVRNYDEFVDTITKEGIPSYVTFDHDLADEHYNVMLQENSYTHNDGDLTKTFHYGKEKTGHECANWLVQWCVELKQPFPKYDVHSMNPVGAKRIRDYIEWAKSKFDFL